MNTCFQVHDTYLYHPTALQIDYHHHVIQDIEVRYNSHDGVGVLYSNQYAIGNPEARVFKSCTFRDNKRHGLSIKQLGVNITGKQSVLTLIGFEFFKLLTGRIIFHIYLRLLIGHRSINTAV